MEAYTGFARAYDEFMDNIDYDEWSNYLIGILNEYSLSEGLILDLGCGTGNITRKLYNAGFDMIGLDNSWDMLDIARKKSESLEILYLLQDMREFELYGTMKAIVSLCDSINYITEFEDLVKTFKLVNNYLDPKGIFVFDLKTKHFYESIGDSTIAEDREDCSFIWENYFDQEEKINEYHLSIFVKDEDERYTKYIEDHYQRAYTIEEIEKALKLAGMELVETREAFTKNIASEDNDRIYVIARENGK